MNKTVSLCIAALLAGCQTVPMISTPGERFDVMAFTRAWGNAFNACEVDTLAGFYHPRAVFVTGPSPALLTTPEAIRAAFRAQCTPPEPRRTIAITPTNVQEFGDIVVVAGTAQVSMTRPDGQIVQVPANYSVTYRREAGRWQIVHHHRSLLTPASPAR